MAPWSLVITACLNLGVLHVSANKKIFFKEIMTYEGGTHLMKLHTWVKDCQLSLSFLQILISGWEDNVHYKCIVMYPKMESF